MRSPNLKDIIKKFPQERTAVGRLEALLEAALARVSRGEPAPEYPFEFLLEKTGFSSPEGLALILAELVERGVIQKVVRVESPGSRGGIKDFSSIVDVPDSIHDWRTDQELQITPKNLRVIFKLQHA